MPCNEPAIIQPSKSIVARSSCFDSPPEPDEWWGAIICSALALTKTPQPTATVEIKVFLFTLTSGYGTVEDMLSKTEQVWRHLLVTSFEFGNRRHASLGALADDLGLGVSTVHKALQRPAGIGAVQVRGGGGVRLIDPGRLLLLWAGKRNLPRDLLAEHNVALTAPAVELMLPSDRFVLGGFGAVVFHEKGNYVSGYDRVICYGDPRDLPRSVREAPPGPTRVMVVDPDPLLARDGKVTSLPQAYVDLFNVPGWPAARFVSALNASMLVTSAA